MKTLWSGIGMVAGSGKLQGTVLSKGRGGAIARVRVKPTNPRTNKQIQQRSRLSVRSGNWRGLTAPQQAAWNAAAESGEWSLKNTLGMTFQPTGAQLYNQLNLNLQKVGAAVIANVPSKASLSAILLGALTAADGTPAVSLAFDGTLSADEALAIYATGNLSPGVSRPSRSKFRYLATHTSTSPANLLSAFQAIYGDPIEGQKIFMYAEIVSEVTGQAAQAGSAVAIVAA